MENTTTEEARLEAIKKWKEEHEVEPIGVGDLLGLETAFYHEEALEKGLVQEEEPITLLILRNFPVETEAKMMEQDQMRAEVLPLSWFIKTVEQARNSHEFCDVWVARDIKTGLDYRLGVYSPTLGIYNAERFRPNGWETYWSDVSSWNTISHHPAGRA